MGSLKKFDGSSWINSNLRKLTTDTDTFTTFPAIIYAKGTNATVGLKGNTTQSGTPTPDSPIMPEGTGERTGNLFDSTIYELVPVSTTAQRKGTNLGVLPQGTYTFNAVSAVSATPIYRTTKNGNTYTFEAIGSLPYTFTADGVSEQIIRTSGTQGNTWADEGYSNIMLNTGSTPLPYEPYGYKIPISSANTTTPVYLGEVETTRKIKKLVLTGEENWQLHSSQANLFALSTVVDYLYNSSLSSICSHYTTKVVASAGSAAADNNTLSFYFNSNSPSVRVIYIKDITYSTAADFKTYLQQQYAAGTPVTIWYVLATEETAVVNEPLMKIGDYADTVSGISIPVTAGGDTLSVGTTVQPSEVTANYYGWHTIMVHERESGQWD